MERRRSAPSTIHSSRERGLPSLLLPRAPTATSWAASGSRLVTGSSGERTLTLHPEASAASRSAERAHSFRVPLPARNPTTWSRPSRTKRTTRSWSGPRARVGRKDPCPAKPTSWPARMRLIVRISRRSATLVVKRSLGSRESFTRITPSCSLTAALTSSSTIRPIPWFRAATSSSRSWKTARVSETWVRAKATDSRATARAVSAATTRASEQLFWSPWRSIPRFRARSPQDARRVAGSRSQALASRVMRAALSAAWGPLKPCFKR